MRLARVALFTAAAIVALVVVAIVALLLFVHPDEYRGRIEQAVRQRTGREFTIGGKLELKIFPWLALSVQKLSLGNPPQFGSQAFLTVQSASIGVKLLPLLAKRLEVSRIAVTGLSAHLVSRGTANNWQDLSESRGPPAPASRSGAGGGPVSIGSLDIRDCVLVLSDEAARSTTTLSIDEFQAANVDLASAPSRLSLRDFALRGSLLSRTPGETAGSAKPLSFSVRAPGLELNGQTQALAPAKIEASVGALSAILSVSGEKVLSDRVLSGSIDVPKVSARRVLESLGVSPPVTRDSRVLSELALKTNFRLTRSRMDLSGLDLTLDDTHVQGTAAITDLQHEALGFDLSVNAINLDRYRPPAPNGPAPGAKKSTAAQPKAPQAPTPLPIDTLRKLNAHGTLRVGTATFAGLVFTNVLMPLAAQEGLVHLGPTQARVYGGTYNGDIVLDARPAQAKLSLSEHVHGTDMGALLKAAFDSTRLSGHADANVTATGNGNTNEALTSSLAGKIDANVTQGALNGIDIAHELQSANALLKREVPPKQSGPARTPFNALQTSGTLDRGVLRTDVLRIETDFLKVNGTGTLTVATEGIDYRLVATLTQGAAASHSGAAGGAAGLDVPLLVTGTVASPTVRPDLEALARGQLRQKAGDLARKELGDKLKGLLRH